MLRFGAPRRGLKLGPAHAAWVDLSRTWWGKTRRRSRQIELAPGIIRPSPVEPNIPDLPRLTELLRGLIKIENKNSLALVPISLVLSDLCVRSTVLELEKIPPQQAERDALIRWRLDREAFFPLSGAKVMSQVIGPKTVLAVVIRESVLRQYEAVCETLGLAAVEIGITSFRLCNTAAGLLPTKDSAAWVSLLDGAFTLVVFQQGRPAFIRTKLQDVASHEGTLGDLHHSLAYFEDRYGAVNLRRVILVSEARDPELTKLIAEEFSVEVLQPNWQMIPPKGLLPSDDPQHIGMLGAAAGVFGA
jgi:type IV pilus assembly protein PilM